MKASDFQIHNKTELKRTIDSALSICQEATLLACNSAVQFCGRDTAPLKLIKSFYINRIDEIKQNIAQLTDSKMDQVEKFEMIQTLLNQLQEINTKFQGKDQ